MRAPTGAQDPQLEYQVKAAFLFNFAKFVEWPPPVDAVNEPFTICLLGDPFGPILDNTVRNENLDGRPLAIRRLTSADDPRQCQILFFRASETDDAPDILRTLDNAPVLTVGENANFIAVGGMIRFVQTGRRIRFEINPDAAERASLKISSRLLRVADIVRPRQSRRQP